MDTSVNSQQLVRLLADDNRRKIVAALVLADGPLAAGAVAEITRLSLRAVPTRLFSERSPCVGGYFNCAGRLADEFPDLPISCLVPYGSLPVEHQAATDLLASIRKDQGLS